MMISEFPGKVRLAVINGLDANKVFDFVESDNFLLGRDASGSRAHFRLGPEDRTVSRNHFLIEINPPDCYMRDVGSLNGTFIIRTAGEKKIFFIQGREERDWPPVAQRMMQDYHCEHSQAVIGSLKLEDGDLIRVGNTFIKVQVAPDILESAPGSASKAPEDVEPELFHCRHCGRDITGDIQAGDLESLASVDFLCDACRQNQRTKVGPSVATQCWGCKKDVSSQANADGRAAELQEIALYWCPDCVAAQQQNVPTPQIGDYRLIKELGSGGFGIVFLAWQASTHRLSALKITREKIKKDLILLQRFKREVLIHRELLHPNLVRLYDDGVSDADSYYFASEFLPSGSLADYFHKNYRKGIPYQEACQLIIQALEGLAYFHEQRGFVHRDLKPENILLREDREGKLLAKVGDFGLSRSYILHGGTITKPNEYAGTYNFMAPEQITDFKGVKPVSDIYSMGMTLYYLITTEFPYDFASRRRIMELISLAKKPRDAIDIILGDDKPIPIEKKRSDIPKKLAAVINQAIEKDATKRIDSAAAFKKALEEALR